MDRAFLIGDRIYLRPIEKIGMTVECRRPRQLYVDGQWEDHVLMGIFGEDFHWVDPGKGR